MTAIPESTERGLWLDDVAHREDLSTFVERALRLDEAGVIRLRERAGGFVVAWVATGFDVLASRVVAGKVRPPDLSVGADALGRGLPAMDRSGFVDPGFAMDSAWRGALPPDTGFIHLDDVPARVVLDLAQRGVALAKEHSSAHGPPGVAARPGGRRGLVGRRQCRSSDALRIRVDGDGFPTSSDEHG